MVVLTWRELCALAGSRGNARALVRAGAFRRVLYGMYVGSEHLDSLEVRAQALHRAMPPGAVVTGRAGLWLHGADVLPTDQVLDVIVPAGLHRSRPGLRIRSTTVRDDELCEVSGLLVARPPRIVLDVLRTESAVEAVAAADAALRAGLMTVEQLQAAVDAAGGRRGICRAREAMHLVDPRSESLMESRVRVTLVLAGIPPFETQVDFYSQQGEHLGRADLYRDGVVLEYDGRLPHERSASFARDRTRHNGFSEHGLEVRRFTSADYYPQPGALVATVRRALIRAAGLPAHTAVRGPDTLRAPRLAPPRTLAAARRAA